MKASIAISAIVLLLATVCQAQTLPASAPASASSPAKLTRTLAIMDESLRRDWLARWEKNIVGDSKNRYCDKELGEEIGWLMTPFLGGYFHGYVATGETKWIDRLVDWTDSWVKRGVKEPDGYVGWPKPAAAGTKVDALDDYSADSLLGEAMVLRPIVQMSGVILKDPALKAKYGDKAAAYIKLAEQTFEKWDKRGAWRDTKGGGAISIVLPYGIDPKTGKWTDGYDKRSDAAIGFSHPDNKANAVARWLLAMSDATGKAAYRDRAEKWFVLMKSRMKAKGDLYAIWNYWEPAGKWDYKPDGQPKHWVGIHPNGGYYEIDVAAIVDAHEHGLVFTAADIDRLIATALAEKRYWTALAPYCPTIQKKFEETHKPDNWGGLGSTPWYLELQKGRK